MSIESLSPTIFDENTTWLKTQLLRDLHKGSALEQRQRLVGLESLRYVERAETDTQIGEKVLETAIEIRAIYLEEYSPERAWLDELASFEATTLGL